MIYGTLTGGSLVVTDEAHGRPIDEGTEPAPRRGWVATPEWQDQGDAIRRVWTWSPAEGTEAEAALRLARMLAPTLADEQALEVPQLFRKWREGESYEAGERVVHGSVLYRCLEDHVAQFDWAPDVAPAAVYASDSPEPHALWEAVTAAGKEAR